MRTCRQTTACAFTKFDGRRNTICETENTKIVGILMSEKVPETAMSKIQSLKVYFKESQKEDIQSFRCEEERHSSLPEYPRVPSDAKSWFTVAANHPARWLSLETLGCSHRGRGQLHLGTGRSRAVPKVCGVGRSGLGRPAWGNKGRCRGEYHHELPLWVQ